jgi:isoleucyl-tRNA synthetase
MALRPLTEEEKTRLGLLEITPEEASEIEKIDQDDQPRQNTLFDVADKLPLPLAAKTAFLAERFYDSLYGSTQASIGDWQETRAVAQEGRGHDDYAKELRQRADINEQQASEYAYEAKYAYGS